MLEIVGYLAASFTTFSFVPQAVQVIRTRETKGISLSMYTIFTTGVVLWFIYGIIVSNVPIIAANAITTVLASIILYFKIKEKKNCGAKS